MSEITTETKKDPDRHPILNDPWSEPVQHWHRDPAQISLVPRLLPCRRPSQPSGVIGLSKEVTSEDEPYATINRIRNFVGAWRNRGFPGTPARKLLTNWNDRSLASVNEDRPFFCQREATETLSWLFTRPYVDSNVKDVWAFLDSVNGRWNDGVPRVAIKMATGSGKTRTMAMFRAALESFHPAGCNVLVITPNLTVKDRLCELNDLRADRAIVPVSHEHLTMSSLTITNYHMFVCRDTQFNSLGENPTATQKKLLRVEERVEEPSEMLDRVLGQNDGLPLYVFQDEGHHCRRDQVTSRDLREEELDEVKQWYTTLLALRDNRDLRGVIDFSATPSYLRQPTELKSPLFPWCVTDYGVEDAQEAGICKIARVPFKVDAVERRDQLINLYDFCNRKGIDQLWGEEPPTIVKQVFQMLAENWRDTRFEPYRQANRTPAIIAVVNRVDNARALYRWLAGSKKSGAWVPGRFQEFTNIDPQTSRPLPIEQLPTLLVHSNIGDPSIDDRNYKQIVDEQIELRASGKTRKDGTEIIRQIFQTVGQKGQPGEHIRCVISVNMLSEGWDAKTVTHVFGFRAFSSTLLCEQVIGRSLRRPSLDDFQVPEYAEIFGVPYPGLNVPGLDIPPQPVPQPYDVYSVESQSSFRLNWPVVKRFEMLPGNGSRFKLNKDSIKAFDLLLPPAIEVLMRPPEGAGERALISTRTLAARDQAVLYTLAKQLCERCFRRSITPRSVNRRGVYFADAITAIVDWCNSPKIRISALGELTDPVHQRELVERVLESCTFNSGEPPKTIPIWVDEQERFSSTAYVNFTTTLKNHYPSKLNELNRKSELNVAACHSKAEVEIAEWLDNSGKVLRWVRNFRLDWRIPWWDPISHQWREYEPDFLVELVGDYQRFLVLEMKGVDDDESRAKANAAELWCHVMSELSNAVVPGSWRFAQVSSVYETEQVFIDHG